MSYNLEDFNSISVRQAICLQVLGLRWRTSFEVPAYFIEIHCYLFTLGQANRNMNKGGNYMNIFASVISAIFVMTVVFAVLACLYFMVKLFSLGIRKIEFIGRKSE